MRHLLVSGRVVSSPSYPETRDALDHRWGTFLAQADLLPILIPLAAPHEHYFSLEACGLLLTGGNDLSSQSPDPLSKLRDARERVLVAEAERAGLPVLGVCRGLQLLAEAAGFRIDRVAHHAATEHLISVSAESRYLAAFDSSSVNSYHDIGVFGEGADFVASAHAPDGSVEAIEHHARESVGIMWHPERYDSARSEDLELFRCLFGGG